LIRLRDQEMAMASKVNMEAFVTSCSLSVVIMIVEDGKSPEGNFC
jgi:hypothetical protein